MEEYSQLTEFGKVLIFLIMGIFFVGITFLLSKVIAPHHPNPVKNSSYECGEDAIGSSWVQFNSRFYVIALIFLLFDVEMVFVFPWATVFSDPGLIAADPRWGWLSFIEMMIFISILLLGLVYVWKKKDLDWIKPNQYIPATDNPTPLAAYQAINSKVYVPGSNKQEVKTETINTVTETSATPKFVPRFKKPL